MKTRTTLTCTGLALALLGSTFLVGAGTNSVTKADASIVTLAGAAATGYQGKLTCCKHLVLGPQWRPTVVVRTPPLPAGKYMVNAIAGAVIAGNDQIVCAVVPSNMLPPGNDGIFGTAGNGSPGPIYGTAPIADTWEVTTAGTSLVLTCNSFNYGKGTYIGAASITALPVGTLRVSSS